MKRRINQLSFLMKLLRLADDRHRKSTPPVVVDSEDRVRMLIDLADKLNAIGNAYLYTLQEYRETERKGHYWRTGDLLKREQCVDELTTICIELGETLDKIARILEEQL